MDPQNELEQKIELNNFNERLQNMLKFLSKCKLDFVTVKEECIKLKEINLKLELELKETRELSKAHRCQLQTSYEMIGTLQDTVSHLVYLKRDMKKLKDDITSKDISIESMEKDKEKTQQNYNNSIAELQKENEKCIQDLTSIYENRIQQLQFDFETKHAHSTCAFEELQNKLRDMEKEYMNKAMEYEEKIQRSAAEVAQLSQQLRMQAERNDANINAYRRKLEDLEGKLKQNQFKDYLAQNINTAQSSPFENRVERPYSVHRDYTDMTGVNTCPIPKPAANAMQNMHTNKNINTPKLQFMYQDNKAQKLSSNDKKGHFCITKKRKLYTPKEFLE